MIRCCDERDFELIWSIINDGAHAYEGVIPADCWTEPYMSSDKLHGEMEHGVTFWGYEEDEALKGVMGIQQVEDVTLVRHAYVRTDSQNRGIGSRLLFHLRKLAHGPVLIGTWADAVWAIRFYEKHGFHVVAPEQKARLLMRYWNVPDRQAEAFGVCWTHMDNELVILHVCADIDQAYLLRSVFEGSGIHVFIPDEYSVRVNPAIAIAGVRLVVRKEDVARARAILASVERKKRQDSHS